MQFRIQWRLDVVVVDFALFQQHVLDPEIKWAGGGITVRFRKCGEVCGPILSHQKVQHRVLQHDLVEIHLFAKQGNNCKTDFELVCMGQGYHGRRLAATNCDSINIKSERRQVCLKVADSHLRSYG